MQIQLENTTISYLDFLSLGKVIQTLANTFTGEYLESIEFDSNRGEVIAYLSSKNIFVKSCLGNDCEIVSISHLEEELDGMIPPKKKGE